jgi:hypothetical protein
MSGLLPILVPGPKKPHKPSKRELARKGAAAQKAADGHRAFVASHTADAGKAKTADDKDMHERMAKTHIEAAEGYEAQVKAFAEQAKTARR